MSHGDDYKPHCGDFVVPGTLAGLLTCLAAGTCRALVTEVGMEAGSVADWVVAIATVAALGAAVVAARAAYAGLATERTRDLDRDDEQRRQQAQAFGGWVTQVFTANDGATGEIVGVRGIEVVVNNASQLPISAIDITVYFENKDGLRDPVHTFNAGVIAPFERPEPRSALFPDDSWIPIGHFDGIDPVRLPAHYRVELEFNDTAGQRWRRDGAGHLDPIDGGPATKT